MNSSDWLHIGTGTGRAFLVRVRYHGCRNYIIKSRHRSCARAVESLGRYFATDVYKRGDVLMIADHYDPVQVVEIVKR